MNITQALDYIETNFNASAERDEILMFVRNSPRGVIKGYFQ
jgi:UDP-N-acetylglucosamine acyltransferase